MSIENTGEFVYGSIQRSLLNNNRELNTWEFHYLTQEDGPAYRTMRYRILPIRSHRNVDA